MSFNGVYTVVYGVKDIQKAKDSYAKILCVSSYFDQPYCVGFNVAGYESGLNPDTKPVQEKNTSVVACWCAHNIE